MSLAEGCCSLEGKDSHSLKRMGLLLQHPITFEKGDGILEGNTGGIQSCSASGREQRECKSASRKEQTEGMVALLGSVVWLYF